MIGVLGFGVHAGMQQGEGSQQQSQSSSSKQMISKLAVIGVSTNGNTNNTPQPAIHEFGFAPDPADVKSTDNVVPPDPSFP